jgi:isohexenylglutaconyl-CoA hydratase
MIDLPVTSTLRLREESGVLEVLLNRPERKNALSSTMVDELMLVFTSVVAHAQLRAIVLRGAANTFCAGADLKDMQAPRSGDPNEQRRDVARANRRLGDLLTAVQSVAQPVVAVVEGAVLGGGIGLVCVSDVALAAHDARFGLPETGLGLVPAQIAPFVVQRIGLTHARRLMLTGARVAATEAYRLGLVHEVFDGPAALDAGLARVLGDIRRCAPDANARTKRLLFSALGGDLQGTLDLAAQVFAEASLGAEAREGTLAFVEKRTPSWAAESIEAVPGSEPQR